MDPVAAQALHSLAVAVTFMILGLFVGSRHYRGRLVAESARGRAQVVCLLRNPEFYAAARTWFTSLPRA